MIRSRVFRSAFVSIFTCFLLLMAATAASALATTRRVSVTSTGAQANYGGSTPGVSADGRYIAYLSDATNLVPGGGDTNNSQDVFVYDRQTRQVVRVSVMPDGSEGFPPYPASFGGEGLRPAISADGRFVAFYSFLQLVPGDTNNATDIYVHDRDVDQDGIYDEPGAINTVRVDVATNGDQATPYNSYYTDISADGRYVVFASDATNLVPGDTNGRRDVFVHDRDTDGDGVFDEPGATSTVRMSVATDGTQGNEESTIPRISADGRYVTFIGGASNLVSGDTNGRWDVFVRDRDKDQNGIMDETGPGAVETFRASPTPDGDQFTVDVNSGQDVSADGGWIGFEVPSAPSGAVSNLLYAFNTQTRSSQFVKNLGSSSTMRTLAISGDGASIVTNEGSSVVLVDRATAATETISVFSGGSPAPGDSVAMSDDARFVGFSSSSALVPGDTNSQSDVYLRDRSAPPLTAPGAPTDVVAVAGDHSATLSWSAPDDGGAPIQYYTVTASPPAGGPIIVNAPNLDTTITGLTPGTSYTFSVTATNSVGTGPSGTSNSLIPTGVQRFTLDVDRQGSGGGTVTSDPAGIDCGSTCSVDFDQSTVVTLTAVPTLGSTFDGWSGAGCSGADLCTVTMDAARSVTATFSNLPPLHPGFGDGFDGTALDSAKWNTSIATSGVRWCPSTQADHLSVSGQWQDVATLACHGVFASPPHGSVTVSGGTAAFTAPTRRTFPYVWRGGPSLSSPFPSTGAFVLQVRMRFPSLAPSGTELNVGDWPNTDPIDDNPPGNSIFSVGACNACGLVANLLGTPTTVLGSATAFHDYRLEYVNGRYSLWIDGVRTMGPVASSIRPDSIWFGNPVFTFWTSSDWTDLTMDSVSVLVERYPLDVTLAGKGGGTVTSDPAGIDCGSTCQHEFLAGTQVTLTATADDASSFTGWSGGGCSGTDPCVVTMDQARAVTAAFSPTPATRFVLSVISQGGGRITSLPGGIDCGGVCQADFEGGTLVTLLPDPGSGWAFDGWTGGGCAGLGSCTVSLREDTVISARFRSVPVGQVFARGNNDFGQLGLPPGTGAYTWYYQRVGGIDGVVAVSGGYGDSMSLRSDGSVWAWGDNGVGQLGDGTTTSRSVPGAVQGLSNVIAISAGAQHNLALKSDGTVWAWGNNFHGALGDGTTTGDDGSGYFNTTPVRAQGIADVVAVSAGYDLSLALRSNGEVWAWGKNYPGGQVGIPPSHHVALPTRIAGLSDIVSISAGVDFALALASDGTVYSWGINNRGQLGLGAGLVGTYTPTAIAGLPPIVAIDAGLSHAVALDSTSHVWGWGNWVELGTSTQVDQPLPIDLGEIPDAVSVVAGHGETLVLTASSTLVSWPPSRFVANLRDVATVASSTWYHTLVVAGSLTPSGESIQDDIDPGQSLSTDVEGDGATPSDPIETKVTSPTGGIVTIEDAGVLGVPAVGYAAAGTQVAITAPQATPESPNEIEFLLDATQIPAGVDRQRIAIFRNGNLVLGCNPDPLRQADPDPCVEERETLADGDERILVLTSEASLWQLGFPAPVADSGGPYAVIEGLAVQLDATYSTGTAPLSFSWFPTISLDDPTLARPSFTGLDDGPQQLTVQVTDASGLSATAITTVTVTNATPVVHVTGPAVVVSGTTVPLSASFTDAGRPDTHAASVNWGDGTTTVGTVTETNGSGAVAGSHRYLVPGNYAITVKVTDDDGGVGQATSASFTVARSLVGIDVKPGDSTNTVQLSSKQVLVAVLSTSTFNATTQVVRTSLTFGRTGAESSLLLSKGIPSCSTPDVNRDGRKDLQCTFTTSLTGLRTTDTQAILRAKTSDVVFLEGRNMVKVIK